MIKKLLLVFSLLLLAASACSDGTGGSVSGTRQSCQSIGGSITCEGGINRLSGTFTHEVETSFYNDGDTVRVDAEFTVESGQMKVSIQAPDGSLTEAEASPGTPATLSGMASVESTWEENVIPITLQALDGNVEGISFEISINK